MITVLQTPPQNTVQDLGRFGYRELGVGTAGAMDGVALQAGNILLGNQRGAAALEIQTFPFVVRFDEACFVAVTGADAKLDLSGRPFLPWSLKHVEAGQLLSVERPSVGARVYLCVQGGIEVPTILGSRSTQLRGGFGGLEGRFLEGGDVLKTGHGSEKRLLYGASPPKQRLEQLDPVKGVIGLRAIPATDYFRFPEHARHRFWNTDWKISPQSNRTGYRLKGEPVLPENAVELRSYGVVPGIVQVPPSGEPIVQMADANTAGGYPRIASVIEADLWRLGQAPVGSRIRFVQCDHAEGIAAMSAVTSYLSDLMQVTSLYQGERDTLSQAVS
ncbi:MULTISPECIES: biotin-dependent carboxyltransferase family protein [Gluconobacter]|uniref:5-oxoprolinase subunit C family protein n=1 Tax=Gluconobacter TaxID=441 RepID=UPI0039E7A073